MFLLFPTGCVAVCDIGFTCTSVLTDISHCVQTFLKIISIKTCIQTFLNTYLKVYYVFTCSVPQVSRDTLRDPLKILSFHSRQQHQPNLVTLVLTSCCIRANTLSLVRRETLFSDCLDYY